MNNATRFTSLPESPLRGVTREAWRSFYAGLQVQPHNTISESGGLGIFDIRPRRLVELGYATGLHSMRRPTQHAWLSGVCSRCRSTRTAQTDVETCSNGRQIQICEFILPWTQARFLSNAYAQYAALAQSMRLYYDALRDGKLVKPKDASMAGSLVVLHRGGRGALEAWPKLFSGTKTLFNKVQKAF
jgi:hypothetical protein